MATAGHQPTDATRPMRADARRNYERIVAVARDVFAEHGAEAPLDDIARRAHVGAGTLYRHFPSRDTLIEAVYRGEIETLCARAYELLDDRSPDDALNEWMREHVSFVLNKRGLAMTLKAALERDSETFALCKTKLRDAAAALLTAAQDVAAVRADVRADDLLRLGHAVGVATERAPEDTERLLSLMLDGLRVQPG
jgi:AcrR family transcriptional regulator